MRHSVRKGRLACALFVFVLIITTGFALARDHQLNGGVLPVASQASSAPASQTVTNNLTVGSGAISLGSTLQANGQVSTTSGPLANASIALHLGDITVAHAQTDQNGQYTFTVPVSTYYFPAAFSNGATIYTVVEPRDSSFVSTPSAATGVPVDLIPLFVIFVFVGVIVLGLYLYARQMHGKVVFGQFGKRHVTPTAEQTITAQVESPLSEAPKPEQAILDAAPQGGVAADEPPLRKRLSRPHRGKSGQDFFKLSRIYIDFISSLKIFFRGGSSFFWALAFPVVIMLVFGSVFSGNIHYELAVQNKDGSDTSAAFIKAVNATNALKVRMVNASEDSDAYIKSNRISAMLIIPKGFGTYVQQDLAFGAAKPSAVVQVNPTTTGQENAGAVSTTNANSQSPASSNNTAVSPAAVILKIDQSSTSAPGVTGIVNSIAKSFYSQLTGSKQINVTNQKIFPLQFKYVDFFVPGIIGLTVLTTGVLVTVGTHTQYRKNGILRKLATTPLKKYEWMISKMLYQSVIVFISTALIIVVAKLVYDVRTTPDAMTLLLLVAGTICFTGIGMIIARFVKDGDAANAAASAIMFPMLFLCGTFIPLEQMPDYLQTVAKVLPLTYLNYGLRDAMILGDTASAMYNMSMILIPGVVFFVIGAIITDWREL